MYRKCIEIRCAIHIIFSLCQIQEGFQERNIHVISNPTFTPKDVSIRFRFLVPGEASEQCHRVLTSKWTICRSTLKM